jgi:hypothetical protein
MLQNWKEFKDKYPLELRIKIKTFLTKDKAIAEIFRNLDKEEKMYYVDNEIIPLLSANDFPVTTL